MHKPICKMESINIHQVPYNANHSWWKTFAVIAD